MKNYAHLHTDFERNLRHIGSIVFLAMLGLVAALIPLAIYSVFVDNAPTDPLLYFGASLAGGAVVGWVLRK